MARRTQLRWQDLSPRTRRLVVAGATLDATLRLAALADLRRRSATQVRGRRWVWGLALGLVSSGGTLPAVYFWRGRHTD